MAQPDNPGAGVSTSAARARAGNFCARYGIELPILLAPMAGACPAGLSTAVANAGGMGAMGALLMQPEGIAAWADAFRRESNGAFQLNLWVPEPPPERNSEVEASVRRFLGLGPRGEPRCWRRKASRFRSARCAALLAVGPKAVSSIMGIFDPQFVASLKARGIAWFATATTVSDAIRAQDAGANAIIAQGIEAGGHRGAFDQGAAERRGVGLFALVPRLADKVSNHSRRRHRRWARDRGGIDVGASTVQIGTAFLRCPEANINPAWAESLAGLEPEDTVLTRAFSGRLGRAVNSAYVRAAAAPDAPAPAHYPVQRGLTQAMREHAQKTSGRRDSKLGPGNPRRAEPAAHLIRRLWQEADALCREERPVLSNPLATLVHFY